MVIKKIVIYIIALAIAIALTVGSLYLMGALPREPRFFSTMEQAFANDPEGGRDFGEILFIDDHGDNLTVFHRRNNQLTASHYLRDVREDGAWYACVGVSTGGAFFYPDPDNLNSMNRQLHIHFFLNERGPGGIINEGLRDTLGRRPVHGFSHEEKIHNLTINGYSVNYVILLEEASDHPLFGEVPLFFWYFSDLPLVSGPAEDIVISFE